MRLTALKKLESSPALRGRITRALHAPAPGAKIAGRYSGIRCAFTHSQQPDLSGNRIEYRAALGKQFTIQGKTDSIWNAIQSIQSAVERYRTQ